MKQSLVWFSYTTHKSKVTHLELYVLYEYVFNVILLWTDEQLRISIIVQTFLELISCTYNI